MKRQTSHLDKLRKFEFFFGLALLLLGCLIYLLFRSTAIHLYQWCESLGFGDDLSEVRNALSGVSLPDFAKYSLPDGLYCAAYILIMDAIWIYERKKIKYVLICAIPLVAVVHEILQGLHLAEGTFDVADVVSYAMPLVLYFIFIFTTKTKNLRS